MSETHHSFDPHASAIFNLHRKRQGFNDSENRNTPRSDAHIARMKKEWSLVGTEAPFPESDFDLMKKIERELDAERAEAAETVARANARAERAEAAETVALANWNGALERAIKAEADLVALAQCHDDNCRGVVKIAAELATEREKVRVLREALMSLMDEQGAAGDRPLVREWWQAAINKSRLALVATEDAK